MKNVILLLFLLGFSSLLSAKDIIINQPAYEVNTSGITNVSRIELKKNETRLYIHSTFIPNWWVKFPANTFIEDCETGERWMAKGIERGQFDKEIYMPESGDSTVVLIFPPLGKTVKKIDYGEEDEIIVYGISLDPKEKTTKPTEVPTAVTEWLEKELEKAKVKTLANLDSQQFFTKDTARLVGYIKGYDPRLNFSTGVVYAENSITREDYPLVIQIEEDGRFECDIPLSYPVTLYSDIREVPINFYIEPGQTLGIILDWEEFRKMDRYRDRSYNMSNIVFMGPAGKINQELAMANHKVKKTDFTKIHKEGFKLTPEEYKVFLNNIFEEGKKELDGILDKENLLPQTKYILENQHKLEQAIWLFEYANNYMRSNNQANSATKNLPADYYDFLTNLPLNDQKILIIRSYDTFLNRLEYCSVFQNKANKSVAKDSAWHNYFLAEWNMKDSVYTHNLKLNNDLAYQITKVRALDYYFKDLMQKKEGREFLDSIENDIHNSFLIAEAERIFGKNYPEINTAAYELPKGKGSKIFKKIIAPFKGKYLVVDFWGIFCGPCIHSIKNNKEVREHYKNSDDVAFIFITDRKQSPTERYNKFVEEQELEHTYMLTEDEFAHLRQLFKFNGIPRYVLVDREGKILNDNFHIYSFKNEIKKLLQQ